MCVCNTPISSFISAAFCLANSVLTNSAHFFNDTDVILEYTLDFVWHIHQYMYSTMYDITYLSHVNTVCSVRNCTKCSRDTCEECQPGFELLDNVCSKYNDCLQSHNTSSPLPTRFGMYKPLHNLG